MEAGVVGNGEEFQGFQGSGGLVLLKQLREGFGHFVSSPPLTAEEYNEEADLDRGLCACTKSKSATRMEDPQIHVVISLL